MTMIAIHADRDQAVVMTDTSAYTLNCRHLGRSNDKALPLDSIRAMVVCRGWVEAGEVWKRHARDLSAVTGDFDEFTDLAEPAMREVWAATAATMPERFRSDQRETSTVIFHVGWSPTRHRYCAAYYTSTDGFVRHDLADGLFVVPTPLGVRPSPLERDQLAADADMAAIVEWMDTHPAVTPPGDVAGWVGLAQAVRRTRAVTTDPRTGLKVLVFGDVQLHLLTAAGRDSGTVHRFDDDGDEFRQMLHGTLHPHGQLGPCPCGSGDRYLDCHLADADDEPCTCTSGRTFGDCCRITPTSRNVAPLTLVA